jgi:hypothetical protein
MDINDAWKSTCKTLLGEEVGDLGRYRKYLLKYMEPVSEKTSAISGKPVIVADSAFSPGAKFIGGWETAQYGKDVMSKTKLDVNDMKDLDSLVSALGESLYYSGSTSFGTSTGIERSTACWDSTTVYESHYVRDNSRYVAFLSRMRSCEFVFGARDGAESKFLIKGYAPYRDTRCMEALRSKPASDCYYLANSQGCTNCMFSFNLRSINYAIGNTVFPKEQYMKLREKLLEDIRSTLEQKKEVPSIVDIIAGGNPKLLAKIPKVADVGRDPNSSSVAVPNGMAIVETAFSNAAKIILGVPLRGLRDYGPYLEEYSVGTRMVPSAAGGGAIYVPEFPFYLQIEKKLVKVGESLEYGKKRVGEAKLEKLSLANAAETLEEISCTSPEIIFGKNMNVIECADYQADTNIYRCPFGFDTKNAAYSFFPKFSEDMYGCFAMLNSKCCIRCRTSTNITRCFEVTDSSASSDCYFCHNCEGCTDCMFCFNAKSLRYAIGNRELGRGKYMEIKKKVLGEIGSRLEKDKRLGHSIYSIGCAKNGHK